MSPIPNPVRLLDDHQYRTFDEICAEAALVMDQRVREGHRREIWRRLLKLEETKQVSVIWQEGLPLWRAAPAVDRETKVRRHQAAAHKRKLQGRNRAGYLRDDSEDGPMTKNFDGHNEARS